MASSSPSSTSSASVSDHIISPPPQAPGEPSPSRFSRLTSYFRSSIPSATSTSTSTTTTTSTAASTNSAVPDPSVLTQHHHISPLPQPTSASSSSSSTTSEVASSSGTPTTTTTRTTLGAHPSSPTHHALQPHTHHVYTIYDPTVPSQPSVLSKNPLLTRIGLDPLRRIGLITASASFWGFVLGGVIGSKQSSLQYMAENAHRLPKNTEGWYFYHKRKNYRMIWGAVSKGAVYSAKTGAMVALFETLEAATDFYRGGADLLNSMAAGVASGAIFSALNKLPRQSSKRAVLLGAGYGLVSGGLQDFSSFLKGTPVWYLPQSLKERSLALKINIDGEE